MDRLAASASCPPNALAISLRCVVAARVDAAVAVLVFVVVVGVVVTVAMLSDQRQRRAAAERQRQWAAAEAEAQAERQHLWDAAEAERKRQRAAWTVTEAERAAAEAERQRQRHAWQLSRWPKDTTLDSDIANIDEIVPQVAAQNEKIESQVQRLNDLLHHGLRHRAMIRTCG